MRPSLPETRFEIIGTDADPEVLRRAEKGCFPSSSLENSPAKWRELAFTRDDDRYCVGAEYRGGIVFLLEDIRSGIPRGPFDLILCRNLVFTYFELERQSEISGRIAESLRDTGYLVIGAHEQLPEGGPPFVQVRGCPEISCKGPSH